MIKQRFILATILPICVIIVWEIVSARFPGASSVLSSPHVVAYVFVISMMHHQFWIDLLASLARALGGWAVATLLGVPLGIAMARNRALRNVMSPLFNLLRPISPVAWIPLAILWFGVGYGSKIFIVGLISFFVVLANAFQAAAAIDPLLMKAAKTLTTSRVRIVMHVVIPASAHGVAIGAQFALSSAWGGVIIAEYTGANSGVGYRMLRAANLFLPADVMMGMLVVAIVGYLINATFKFAIKTKAASKYLG